MRRKVESVGRILVISQVYVPDPAAGGQLLADACEALAERGHHVRVICSDRGYDDPSERYPPMETRNRVSIERLALTSFGKRSAALRLLGGIVLTMRALVRGTFGGRVDTVLVSTFPPTAPLAALWIAWIRGASLVYWVMDLNPDQAVALGQFSPGSLPVRGLDAMQRMTLARATHVVVLDRFMEKRVREKRAHIRQLTIVPPWPLRPETTPVPRALNAFRERHGFGERLVVMYSGNHGTQPLHTIIDAAVRLRNDPRFLFAFVGGGVGKKQVDAVVGPTIRSLPYQSLAAVHESLSSADLHVVTMGDKVVGINHPCKIYDALAVGRPILFVGPEECHISEILDRNSVGWHVRHDDVDGVLSALEHFAAMTQADRDAMGRRGADLIRDEYSRTSLRDAFSNIVGSNGGAVPDRS